jgi:hypothetical protein
LHGDATAALAKLPRYIRLGPKVMQYAESPECLCAEARLAREIDDRGVALHCFGGTATEIVLPALSQQLLGAGCFGRTTQ